MPGEVIGLIGTNGAGKSTLLNAIGGYVPRRGTVELLGHDVERLPRAPARAHGLGRTFQAATLFPELTVRETVQLALEARGADVVLGSTLLLPAVDPRRAARSAREAAELIDFLGLGRYADRFVAELSTGTRRIVELASVLAVAPRVICLDEPTAGVAQREAEAFGPLIKRVQQELDATLVVVEHDLPMILSLSDRVYCMEAGRGHRRGRAARRAQQPAGRSRRTSAPTTAPSNEQQRARGSHRGVGPGGSHVSAGLRLAAADVLDRRERLPVAVRPDRRVERDEPEVSSASYLPLQSDAMSVVTRSILPKVLTVFVPVRVGEVLPDLLGDVLEHEQLTARSAPRCRCRSSCHWDRCDLVWARDRLAGLLLVDVDALLQERALVRPTARLRRPVVTIIPSYGFGSIPAFTSSCTCRAVDVGVGDELHVGNRALILLDELLRRHGEADQEQRVDVLGLPLLDEAVELRLRRGGVGPGDRQDRRRTRLAPELLRAA